MGSHQFEDNKHLQKYEETNGTISYLKSNTAKQLVSLKIYMILLISKDRPAGQKYHPTHDLKTAPINEMLDPRQLSVQEHTPFLFCIYEVSYPCGACPIQERYQIR